MIILLAVSIFLRSWGLTSHSVPDESFEIDRALNALKGNFDWQRIGKGGLYLLLIPVYSIESFFRQGYNVHLLSGRIVQIFIGMGIVYYIFRNLMLLYGYKWALLFTIPVVFNAQLIYTGHHVNVQNLMFLGLIIHLYFVLRGLKEKDNAVLGLSLLPLSLATASQLSAAITLAPFALLLAVRYATSGRTERKETIRIMLRYAAASVVLYVVMTPGIIFFPGSSVKNIAGFVGLSSQAGAVTGTPSSYLIAHDVNFWKEYARYALNFFGTFNCFLIFASVIYIFIKQKWLLLYPLSLLIIFYLVFANASPIVYSGRYIIPGLLMGFIIMPLAVIGFYDRLASLTGKPFRLAAVAVIFLIALNFGRGAVSGAHYSSQFSLADTRDIVSDWLRLNASSEDRILLENTCNFPVAPIAGRAVYVEHWNLYPRLSSLPADLVVINVSILNFLSSKGSGTSYRKFYDELIKSPAWVVVHSEKPARGKSTGPELLIYKRISVK